MDEVRAAFLGELEPVPRSPNLCETFLPDVAELIRELGLEEVDASVLLAPGNDGELKPTGDRVSPETVHIWLQGRLFNRLEAVSLTNPLLELERRASWWTFER